MGHLGGSMMWLESQMDLGLDLGCSRCYYLVLSPFFLNHFWWLLTAGPWDFLPEGFFCSEGSQEVWKCQEQLSTLSSLICLAGQLCCTLHCVPEVPSRMPPSPPPLPTVVTCSLVHPKLVSIHFFVSTSSTPLLVLPGIISPKDRLYSHPYLSVCFWGNPN